MKLHTLTILLAVGFTGQTWGVTYYVDADRGADTHDGLSIENPWESISPLEGIQLEAGDTLLLKAGCRWNESLVVNGSGNKGKPIQIASYGEGKKPIIDPEGSATSAIRLFNQEYIEIRDLEISNMVEDRSKSPRLRGVEISARDMGSVRGIVLENLHIHHVSGPIANYEDGDIENKMYGGIITLITGEKKQTFFDGLTVSGCLIEHVVPNGMSMHSSWDHLHNRDGSPDWKPSINVVIRGNTFRRTARNGLIVRVAKDPLVEYNLFEECAWEGSGNASFAFHCEGAVFQFNEAWGTRYNPGDHDAAGFDSDWNSRGTIIQYNYSHDNDFGFVLVCCNGSRGFNLDTVVRYNLSVNDGGNSIRLSGTVENVKIYNNTIITSSEMKNPYTREKPGEAEHGPRLVYYKSWNGWPDGVVLANNLFINFSEEAGVDLGKSQNIEFYRNFIWENGDSMIVESIAERLEEAQLVMGPMTPNSRRSILSSFKPLPESKASSGGLRFEDHATHDFLGQPISQSDDVAIGAMQAEPLSR